MELSNLETLPGRTIIRHLGLVQGSTVRSKHAGKDLLAGFKNFVGGELKATCCVTRDDAAILSQHVGDMANVETLAAFEHIVDHLCTLFRVCLLYTSPSPRD